MGIQDSSRSHVDSMCGDGQSKLYMLCVKRTLILYSTYISEQHRKSASNTGQSHFMTT